MVFRPGKRKRDEPHFARPKPLTMGLEIEVAVPVLKPGRPALDDNIPQPLDLISIAEQRHNIVHPALGTIKFEEFNTQERWGKRISSTIFVPTTIYMADALETRPRSDPAFKDQIGPRIPVGSEPLAYADWANPYSLDGRFLPNRGTYEVHPRQITEGWKIEDDGSIEPTYFRGPHANPRYRDLFAGEKYDMRSKYTYVPLEANSPILWATAAGFKECERAIKAITGSSRAEVNSSTGMHVHVGNGDAGFDLPTLKLLIVALLVWEPMIGTLHPLWRRGWGIGANLTTSAKAFHCGDGSRFCKPLRNAVRFDRPAPDSRFWRQVPDWWFERDLRVDAKVHYWNMADPIAERLPSCVNGHADIPAWAHAEHMRREYTERHPRYNYSCLASVLRRLQAVETIDELHSSLTSKAFDDDIGKYAAYNLYGLTTDAVGDTHNGGKKTIEFRQHAGCLDPCRVHMWMRFCTAVTAWAKMMTSQGSEVHNGVHANLFNQLKRQCDHALDDTSPPPQNLRSIFAVIGISDEEIIRNGWEGYINGDGWDRWEYKFYTGLRDEEFNDIWFATDGPKETSFFQIFFTEEEARRRDKAEKARDAGARNDADGSTEEITGSTVKIGSDEAGEDEGGTEGGKQQPGDDEYVVSEEDSEADSEDFSEEVSDDDDDNLSHDPENDCVVINMS